MDKEELITFRNSSGSSNFLKDSSTLQDRTFFPQSSSYLWKISTDLHENFTIHVSVAKKVSSKFLQSSGPGVALEEVCAL